MSITWFILGCILGLIAGIIVSVHLFAIDVDILAIPYLNKGVVLTEDIVIEQDNIQLSIPKGTQLTLRLQMPGMDRYGIDFYVPYNKDTPCATF